MICFVFSSCQTNYVELDDGTGRTNKFCGVIDPANTYHYEACSNNVKLSYKTTALNNNFRGFRAYYEGNSLNIQFNY